MRPMLGVIGFPSRLWTTESRQCSSPTLMASSSRTMKLSREPVLGGRDGQRRPTIDYTDRYIPLLLDCERLRNSQLIALACQRSPQRRVGVLCRSVGGCHSKARRLQAPSRRPFFFLCRECVLCASGWLRERTLPGSHADVRACRTREARPRSTGEPSERGSENPRPAGDGGRRSRSAGSYSS